MTIIRRIQLRRDVATQWTSTNPVLAQGELALDRTANRFKVGDGTTAWNSLSYVTTVDHSQLANLSSDDHPQYHTDARGDARYAALSHTHGAGDIASGTLADARVAASNVTQHQAALSIGWAQLTGVPSSFTPAAHTHAAGDITSGTLADARLSANILRADDSAGTQTVTGLKSFDDALAVRGGGGSNVLVTSESTSNQTVSLPDASGQIVLAEHTQALSNKTLSAPVVEPYATLQVAGTPSAPSAGNLRLYARSLAGRLFLAALDAGDIERVLTPAMLGSTIIRWRPGTGTTASINDGVSWTVAATQAHPAQAATNLHTQMVRATYATSATAGNAAGVRMSAARFWRGNAARLGGFFYFSRFGFTTVRSDMQFWNGLSAQTGLLAGEPSAQNDTVCIGKDSTDANLQLIFRDNAGSNKVDLGVAPAADMVIDVMLFAPPNASEIIARVVRQDGSGPAVLVNNVAYATALPRANQFLLAHHEVRTTAAAAVTVSLADITVASDF